MSIIFNVYTSHGIVKNFFTHFTYCHNAVDELLCHFVLLAPTSNLDLTLKSSPFENQLEIDIRRKNYRCPKYIADKSG